MIHCYKLGGLNIVLDVCSGSVHAVDEVAYDIIKAYEDSTREEITAEILKKYGDREDVNIDEINACFEQIEELKYVNEKVILFHLLGDVFGWIAILVISVILMFWNVSFLDPLLSLIISLWLLYNMGKALHESVCVLLQKSPKNVDVDEIKSQIEGLNHINNVLDIHLWSLDGIDSILTLKINIDDVNNGDEVKKEIYTIASKYHIVDTTVEFR